MGRAVTWPAIEDLPSAPKSVQRRKRKPTLVSVMKQAARARIEVARFEVDPDTGKISVVPGKPSIIPDGNNAIDASEWN